MITVIKYCLALASEIYSVFYAVMGNVKSNKHWEAKLPPNFDRNAYGIEKFIRAK